jgi:hypothetical protein
MKLNHDFISLNQIGDEGAAKLDEGLSKLQNLNTFSLFIE